MGDYHVREVPDRIAERLDVSAQVNIVEI